MTHRASRPFARLESAHLARAAIFVAVMVASPLACALPTITFAATDLNTAVAGHEMWRYDYVIRGPVDAFQDVNLLFPYTSYAMLSVLPAYDASLLSPLVTQPDARPLILGDGQVTVTALKPLAAAGSSPLSVTFAWLGAGKPSVQSFELLDNFSVVATGVTVPAVAAVPETSTAWMLLAGMAGLVPFGIARSRRLGPTRLALRR